MPRYDYFCKYCNNKEERLVDFYEAVQQCKCGGFMERLFSPGGINFQVKWVKPKVKKKMKKMGVW